MYNKKKFVNELSSKHRILPKLFVYNSIESIFGPAQFLTAQFLQKLLINEAFVVIDHKTKQKLPNLQFL